MKLTQTIKRSFVRWDRKLELSKRQQFVIVTFILVAGLVLTQLMPGDYRYGMTIVLSVITFLSSAFALREDLNGIEWITLLTLPTLFTTAVALFYFLLPQRWLTRVPVVALYAIGMYALLLTENIYNVAADRTIALLRAAHSVGFLFTLITYFMLVQTVLAFRFPFYTNMILIFIISLVLAFQSIWSSELDRKASERVKKISLVVAVIMAELACIYAFWPIQATIAVLFFTTSFYGLVGMGQQYVVEKLYKKTVMEFFSLGAIIFIISLLTTHWRGNY